MATDTAQFIGLSVEEETLISVEPEPAESGVMIAVGAAFKFYSGLEEKRAPQWMVKHHLEFIYRIFSEPKKQIKRCAWIVITLPRLLLGEWKRKNNI